MMVTRLRNGVSDTPSVSAVLKVLDVNILLTMTVTIRQSQQPRQRNSKLRNGLIPTIMTSPKKTEVDQDTPNPNREVHAFQELFSLKML